MNLENIIHYVALIVGLVTLIIGISAVIRPKPMSTKFGIAANDATLPYVVSTGIRDVFIGLTVLILFYLSEWHTLGAINICVAVVAISDFLVVRKHGDKKTSYIHLVGAIAVVVCGGWLLFWPT